MRNSSLILPINNKPRVKVYKNYAFPLCILQNNDAKIKGENWIYHHFYNIYLMRNTNEYIWLDFLEPDNSFDDLLEVKHIGLSEIENYNLLNIIKKALNASEYVTIFLDEYYLDREKMHSFSEYFIYGYDEELRVFFTMGYDKDGNFESKTYAYETVNSAFDSLKRYKSRDVLPAWVIWYTFSSLKRKKQIHNSETILQNISELEEYVLAKKLSSKLRPEVVKTRGGSAVYGIECQKEVLKSWHELLNGQVCTDYRHIHLLYEHKMMIYDKMCHINKLLNITNIDCTLEYNIIVKKIKVAKSVILKNMILNSSESIYNPINNPYVINKIINILEYIINNESRILQEYITEIKDKMCDFM